MRTLDIFVSTVLEKAGGKLPQNFVVTLPKITARNKSPRWRIFSICSKRNWTSSRLSEDGDDDRNDAIDHQL